MESPRAEPEESLRRLREALIELHGELVEGQRIEVERVSGRMGPGEALQAAIHDARFAWLGDLSRLITEIVELASAAEPVTDDSSLEELEARTRTLIDPPDPSTEFGARYLRALQEQPGVVLAHRDAVAALQARGA
jgi:hypothetical protein